MSKSQEWFINLVIVCVLGTVVALGIWWHFNSTEWAAWVQALGSVAAILVGNALTEFAQFKVTKTTHSRRCYSKDEFMALVHDFNRASM